MSASVSGHSSRHEPRQLADLVGLSGCVAIEHGSALALPFADASLDVVRTGNVRMTIADKDCFCQEINRVPGPGGRLVFHDIFQGDGGVPHHPTPWAQSAELGALAAPEEARSALQRIQETGQLALGMHLPMVPTAADRFHNVMRNLVQGRITIVQGVACKHAPEQASGLDE